MRRAAAAVCAGAVAIAAAALWWAWTPDLPREAVEAKYLRAPGDLVKVLGAPMHVRDDGPRDAPAVVMIHGFGSHLQTWDGWAAALADDFRVIRFDLPGSGLSRPDATQDYSDERTHAAIVALMERLGVARAHFVGHSIGGRIAWTFAAAHPERTGKLVLISPDGYAEPGDEYGAPTEISTTFQLMRWFAPRAMVEASLRPAWGDPAAMPDELVDRYFDLMRAPGVRDALLRRLAQKTLRDPVPILRALRAPTLLIWGGRDALIPASHAQDYLDALPDARLALFDDLGHVPQEEAPARTVAPVAEFLSE